MYRFTVGSADDDGFLTRFLLQARLLTVPCKDIQSLNVTFCQITATNLSSLGFNVTNCYVKHGTQLLHRRNGIHGLILVFFTKLNLKCVACIYILPPQSNLFNLLGFVSSSALDSIGFRPEV